MRTTDIHNQPRETPLANAPLTTGRPSTSSSSPTMPGVKPGMGPRVCDMPAGPASTSTTDARPPRTCRGTRFCRGSANVGQAADPPSTSEVCPQARVVQFEPAAARRRARLAALAMTSLVAAAAPAVLAPPTSAAAAARCTHTATKDRPELREGDQGDAVTQVQCLLNTKSGQPQTLPQDGHYSPETATAVRWAQKCNKIPETGVTDTATWKILNRPKKGCTAAAKQH